VLENLAPTGCHDDKTESDVQEVFGQFEKTDSLFFPINVRIITD
jgi:hypothetical protein